MQLDLTFVPNVAGLLALAAGLLILVAPKILNYVVALYLILVGIVTVFPNLLAVTPA
jgi:hypothetical protein